MTDIIFGCQSSVKNMKPAIQETSGATDVAGTMARPDAGSLVARPAASDWQAHDASGFSYKTLFEDPHLGLRTILIPHFPSIVDIQCGEKAILL